MELDQIRKDIDAIDSKLLPLFAERMDCAKRVAAVKKAQGLPIFNSAREEAILDRVASQAGEYGNEARILYSTMMGASRALQHKLLDGGKEIRCEIAEAASVLPNPARIACQGVEGAYSHEAALQLYPGCQPVFYKTWGDVFHAIETGEADIGILPVENSNAGSVTEVYDLILKYRFSIAAATTVHLCHCLAAQPGIEQSNLTEIYSHPQALAQCSDYLAVCGARSVPVGNTAEAAKLVSETKGACAAICSEQAAEHFGLTVLSRKVQNTPNNRTRFVAISRGLVIPEDAGKISLCFSLPHSTGSLSTILMRFALSGLNLTKIESRPIAGKNFEYDFYLDFSGNVRNPQVMDLIASLYDELPRFSFLGNYTEQE